MKPHLRLSGTDLYLDSRQPQALCVVSHAHSDHTATHGRAIATPATAALAGIRIGLVGAMELDYYQPVDVLPGVRLTFRPAGHVLGSALTHLSTPDGTLLYTGDYKLRPSLTVPPADLCPADVLVMESTFGQPHFCFPPWRQTADRLVDLAAVALRAGRQPVVLGYSLGKAQEIVRILTDAGLAVTAHGAVANLCAVYERFGVPLGPVRRYTADDFHGPRALDLAERGVLVAPPQVARSAFITRFDNPLSIMMTGWALTQGAPFRYGVDHVLPLSDHADFDELIETARVVNPKMIYTLHGFPQFVDHLRKAGFKAALAKGDPQMRLFE